MSAMCQDHRVSSLGFSYSRTETLITASTVEDKSTQRRDVFYCAVSKPNFTRDSLCSRVSYKNLH